MDASLRYFPGAYLVERSSVGEVVGVGPHPSAEDLVVSEVVDDKDKRFVEAIHAQRPLDLELIERRIGETGLEPATAERATAHIRSLNREEKLSGPKPPWASSEEND